ncbi:hypothetical protein MRB53_000267 [Persea americana]|uniref:Uncharacterized protein n=1 Tax=Persea americana TaxID=3435 RepID=A0ACC2MNE4_PERAE|nr:hypothetical protein MRB53_000267 [Persea americana]
MVENENPMADNELAGILRRSDLVKPHLRFKIFNAAEMERRDLNRLKSLKLSLLQRKRSEEKRRELLEAERTTRCRRTERLQKEIRRN